MFLSEAGSSAAPPGPHGQWGHLCFLQFALWAAVLHFPLLEQVWFFVTFHAADKPQSLSAQLHRKQQRVNNSLESCVLSALTCALFSCAQQLGAPVSPPWTGTTWSLSSVSSWALPGGSSSDQNSKSCRTKDSLRGSARGAIDALRCWMDQQGGFSFITKTYPIISTLESRSSFATADLCG